MKKNKHLFFFLLILIVSCIGLGICAYGNENYNIRFNVDRARIRRGTSTTAIKLVINKPGLTMNDIVFSSADPQIATIDRTGKITGLKCGVACIEAYTKGGHNLYAYCMITVLDLPVTTKKIILPRKSVTLKKGERYTLAPQLEPITSSQPITYKSSNKNVASVSKKGVIIAKKAGTAKITVKSGNKKTVFTVKVEKTQAEQITNIPISKKLKKGRSFTLKPKTLPVKVDDKITYKSSNKKVATVNSKGKVVAKKKGNATITVRCGKISVKCKITVQ